MENSIAGAVKFMFIPEGVIILLFMITVQVGFICQYIVKIDSKIRVLLDRRKMNDPEDHETSDFF